MTVGRIDQSAHFELLEPYPEYPIPRRPSERTEPVPACHRLPKGLWSHLRGGHVLIDVHCLVAVVVLGIACEEGGTPKYIIIFFSPFF